MWKGINFYFLPGYHICEQNGGFKWKIKNRIIMSFPPSSYIVLISLLNVVYQKLFQKNKEQKKKNYLTGTRCARNN